MSGSVFKLKVETNEYDNKLKNAAAGIQHLAKRAHDLQGSFTNLEKEEVEFIRNLGYMNTASKTAVGATRELENAYKGLAATYNSLSDAEKADEGGKALAESLDMLKQRTLEAKKNLDDATKSLNANSQEGKSAGGILDNLASKFVVNVDAMKLFNLGLTAAKGALNVAKDAFFASEANVDEWGRTVQSSKSLYEGFLNAINNGDISGYLSRINEIVTAAREAYNELDRLGTMRTIQAPQISAQQRENERLRMMVQTGRYIGRISGRKETWEGKLFQNGQVLTKEQIQTFERKLNKGVDNIVTLISNEVDQTTKSIDAIYRSQGKDLGLSVKEFRKGTSSMAEFDKRMKMYQKYVDWNAEAQRQFARQGGRGSVDFDKNNPFAAYRVWGNFRVDGERYNSLVQLIQQRDQQAAQAYGMQGQAYRTMNRAEGMTVRSIMNGGGGGTRGGRTTTVNEVLPIGSVAELTKQMQELQKAQQLVTNTDDWKNYQYQIDAVIRSIDKLKGITTVSDRFNTIMAAGGINPADLNRQSVSDIALGGLDLANIPLEKRKEWLGLSQTPSMQSLQFETPSTTEQLDKISNSIDTFTGGFSKIFSGLSAMGIELPKELVAVINAIQGVSSIITGVGTLIELFSTTSHTANTAAVAGNTIALTANTAALASVSAALAANTATNFLPFANGGVVHAAGGFLVPGNHRSGDMVPAMLNSGEVVLNAAQAANLSSILQSGAGENLNLTATISGEQIRLALNNNSRRRGRGEYVTSNTIR